MSVAMPLEPMLCPESRQPISRLPFCTSTHCSQSTKTLSGIVKKIKSLFGLGVSRGPTPPPVSQLSFKIYPVDTSTPPADGSNVGTQTIASDETKTRKALRLQRVKRKSESASVMSSTSSPCKPHRSGRHRSCFKCLTMAPIVDPTQNGSVSLRGNQSMRVDRLGGASTI
jgi:hypothetical protein